MSNKDKDKDKKNTDSTKVEKCPICGKKTYVNGQCSSCGNGEK